jgi:hypothetical protein
MEQEIAEAAEMNERAPLLCYLRLLLLSPGFHRNGFEQEIAEAAE